MTDVLDNQRFAQAYRRLAGVRLNPRRHSEANAFEHSEAVAARAVALARANGCSAVEVLLLANLGRAHDLGKVTGTARPERSLEVLRECGIEDPVLLALVKWHDTNLPWYRAAQRGEPPTEKAWRRLSSELDLRLLAIFMVADRVDAPAGWRRNAPATWFLAAARSRGLLARLRLDLPDHPSEVGAAAALVRGRENCREVLVLRDSAGAFALPEAAIEWDELPEEAAVRSLREQAGIGSAVAAAGREIGWVDELVEEETGRAGEPVDDETDRHLKRVRCFLCSAAAGVELAPASPNARERLWLGAGRAESVALVREQLRHLLHAVLAAQGAGSSM